MLEKDLQEAITKGLITQEEFETIQAVLKIIPEDRIKKIPRGGLKKADATGVIHKRTFDDEKLNQFFKNLTDEERTKLKKLLKNPEKNKLTRSVIHDKNGAWKLIGLTRTDQCDEYDNIIAKGNIVDDKIDLAVPPSAQGSVKPLYTLSSLTNPTKSIRKKGKLSEIAPEIALKKHIPDFSPIPGMPYFYAADDIEDNPEYAAIEIVRFEGEDLFDFIHKDTTYDSLKNRTPVELISIALQIALQLQYLHENGVLYNDLKPENIRIRVDEDGHPHVLVIDYGHSDIIEKNTLELELKRENTRGTAGYFAPEGHFLYALDNGLNKMEFSEKSDTSSLGVTLSILFFQHIQFDVGDLFDFDGSDILRRFDTEFAYYYDRFRDIPFYDHSYSRSAKSIATATQEKETASAFNYSTDQEKEVLDAIGAHILKMRALNKDERPNEADTIAFLQSHLEKLDSSEAVRIADVYNRTPKVTLPASVEIPAVPTPTESAPPKVEAMSQPASPKKRTPKPAPAMSVSRVRPSSMIDIFAPSKAPFTQTQYSTLPPATRKPEETFETRKAFARLMDHWKAQQPKVQAPLKLKEKARLKTEKSLTEEAKKEVDAKAAIAASAADVPVTPALQTPPHSAPVSEPAPQVAELTLQVAEPTPQAVTPTSQVAEPTRRVAEPEPQVAQPLPPSTIKAPSDLAEASMPSALPDIKIPETLKATDLPHASIENNAQKATHSMPKEIDAGKKSEPVVNTPQENHAEKEQHIRELTDKIKKIQKAVQKIHPMRWYDRLFRWLQDKLRPMRRIKERIRNDFIEELTRLNDQFNKVIEKTDVHEVTQQLKERIERLQKIQTKIEDSRLKPEKRQNDLAQKTFTGALLEAGKFYLINGKKDGDASCFDFNKTDIEAIKNKKGKRGNGARKEQKRHDCLMQIAEGKEAPLQGKKKLKK